MRSLYRIKQFCQQVMHGAAISRFNPCLASREKKLLNNSITPLLFPVFSPPHAIRLFLF